MLYPTLNQPLVFLVIFLVGLVSGVVFDVARILTTLTGGEKVTKHIFEFVSIVVCFGLLFVANLHVNYGQFRIYVVIVFLISFGLERLFIKFLWTKLISKWYTNIARRKTNVRKKEKSA